MTARLVAVTGPNGFLGSHIVTALAQAGTGLRLLVRSEPYRPAFRDFPSDFSPEIIVGDLSDPASLAALVRGADAIIHCAGAVKGRSSDFAQVNETGAANIAKAAHIHAPAAHFILVSSLAAREPQLSDYAASKLAGEKAVRASFGGPLTIVRPPALYGPGDRETLAIFKLARWPLIPLVAGEGRVDFMHVADAATILAALAMRGMSGESAQDTASLCFAIASPDSGGCAKREIFLAAAAAMGREKPRFLPLPASLLHLFAWGAGLVPGNGKSMLTPGKVREILHPDWSIHPDEMPPLGLPEPKIRLMEGFASTVAWYRAAGWL